MTGRNLQNTHEQRLLLLLLGNAEGAASESCLEQCQAGCSHISPCCLPGGTIVRTDASCAVFIIESFHCCEVIQVRPTPWCPVKGDRSCKEVQTHEIRLQSAYMPFDEAEAAQSCRGGGQAQGPPSMTVLVTGAAGFIGHRAAVMLRQSGHGAPTDPRPDPLKPTVGGCKLSRLRLAVICRYIWVLSMPL